MTSNMTPAFEAAAPRSLEWLCWLGQPMVYDGGLCVNRTLEEVQENNRHPHARLCV